MKTSSFKGAALWVRFREAHGARLALSGTSPFKERCFHCSTVNMRMHDYRYIIDVIELWFSSLIFHERVPTTYLLKGDVPIRASRAPQADEVTCRAAPFMKRMLSVRT